MILLPPDLRAALHANASATAADPRLDPAPLVKFFNPLGAATWLASELADDGDTLFGLADLGFGCPELGSFSLAEIASVKLPYGLAIERDIAFAPRFRLSVWADWSRHAGSILWAEALLNRVALTLPPDAELPPPDRDRSSGG